MIDELQIICFHVIFYEPINIDFYIFIRVKFQAKIFIDINIIIQLKFNICILFHENNFVIKDYNNLAMKLPKLKFVYAVTSLFSVDSNLGPQ